MVETPRLQAKRKKAKCEHSEHEPTLETNRIILSHPRKRVSRILFFLILFLDSCFRRNDNDTRSGIKVDLKSTLFRNPSPSRRGKVQYLPRVMSTMPTIAGLLPLSNTTPFDYRKRDVYRSLSPTPTAWPSNGSLRSLHRLSLY